MAEKNDRNGVDMRRQVGRSVPGRYRVEALRAGQVPTLPTLPTCSSCTRARVRACEIEVGKVGKVGLRSTGRASTRYRLGADLVGGRHGR